MADVPEEPKLSKVAALLIAIGLVLLMIAALVGVYLNRGEPPGTGMPGPTYPILFAGVATLIGGIVALFIYARRDGPKDVNPK